MFYSEIKNFLKATTITNTNAKQKRCMKKLKKIRVKNKFKVFLLLNKIYQNSRNNVMVNRSLETSCEL